MLLSTGKINVFYEKFHALRDISLQVDEGGFVTLIGSNGAGKTTTLNTIIGLLHPESGNITFKGIHIESLPPHQIVNLGIALVPEARVIFPQLSVLEHILLGAQLPRAWDTRNDTLEWVFQLFPRLKERKNQEAGTLSGGESQMLNIARALMSKPELLLLDEPSLGLAPKLVLTIFDTVRQLHEEGVTILLTEQHVYHALSMCDRAYVIETGRVTLKGSGRELLRNKEVKKKYLGG